VPAGDFFVGLMATTLGAGEIVTAVSVPVLTPGLGAAYVKFAHPASRYSVIGAAAAVSVEGGTISGARVVVGGLVAQPTRLGAVEAALVGQPATADTAARAAGRTADAIGGGAIGDLFASAGYRRAVAGTYVAEAIAAALPRP
jgi:carbon-monoxide dehydrogenase medium subunit